MDSEKVVFVAGSSSGIGEATALLYAEKGYRVVVHGSKNDLVAKVAQACREISPKKLEVSNLTIGLACA